MTAIRSIRIEMPDRPGALSAISAALAAHGVDIVRLDVVSQQGTTVVDDLLLTADSTDSLGMAVGAFRSDVTVRTFSDPMGDAALVLGTALASIAAAKSDKDAQLSLADGARLLLRADRTLLTEIAGDGELRCTDRTGQGLLLPKEEESAAWWCLGHSSAAAFRISEAYGTGESHPEGAWLAMAACPPRFVVAVVRQMSIAFYPGELERLDVFCQAAASILALRGDVPERPVVAGPREGSLPERAVRLAGSHSSATLSTGPGRVATTW